MQSNYYNIMLRKCRTFLRMSFHDRINVVLEISSRVVRGAYYRAVFKKFGKKSAIPNPLRIVSPQYIEIGNNLQAMGGLRLEAIVTKPGRVPILTIGDNVTMGQGVQIVSHCNVRIGDGAGIGPHCFIMDASHPFLDRKSAAYFAKRFSTEDSFVELGEGCLIGAGTVIMPNVRIGKRAVVGSNSVVRKSIPDDCVASGNPAAIQLVYDNAEDRWMPYKAKRSGI